MKKSTKSIIITISLLFATTACGGDLMKADWGMSKSEVMKLEKGEPDSANTMIDEYHGEISESISYTRTVVGEPFNLYYAFDEKGLYSIGYGLKKDYQDGNRYIKIYNDLLAKLIDEYGNPTEHSHVFPNISNKNDESQWAKELTTRFGKFQATWRTPKTAIYLNLTGNYGIIYCGVQYKSANRAYIK